MKLTIHSTAKIVEFNGVPARIWEGVTDSGTGVVVFVTRVAVHEDEPVEVHEQFKRELQEHKPPTTRSEAFPLRMII